MTNTRILSEVAKTSLEILSNVVDEMFSSGDVLDAIHELDTFDDVVQQCTSVQRPPVLCGTLSQLEDHGQAGRPTPAALVLFVRSRTVAKVDSIGSVVQRCAVLTVSLLMAYPFF